MGVVSVDHLSKVRYPRLSTAMNLKQPEQGCVSTAVFPLAAFISSTNPALTSSWKLFELVFNIAMLINAISYQLIQIKERQDVWQLLSTTVTKKLTIAVIEKPVIYHLTMKKVVFVPKKCLRGAFQVAVVTCQD